MNSLSTFGWVALLLVVAAVCKAEERRVYFTQWGIYQSPNFYPGQIPFSNAKPTTIVYSFLGLDKDLCYVTTVDYWADFQYNTKYPVECQGFETWSAGESGNLCYFKSLAKTETFSFVMSIGGWSMSSEFSKCLRDPTKRQAMIESLNYWLNKSPFPADGIDIDWEYPQSYVKPCTETDPCGVSGTKAEPARPVFSAALDIFNGQTLDECTQSTYYKGCGNPTTQQSWAKFKGNFTDFCSKTFGMGVCSYQTSALGLGNFSNPADFMRWAPTADEDWDAYIAFVQAFKAAYPNKKILASVGMAPRQYKRTGKNGWKAFCDAVDTLGAMTYDYYGPWTTTMFSAPLYSPSKKISCVEPGFSVSEAINYIIDNGCDPQKIVIGLPAYGKTWQVTSVGPDTLIGVPNLCQHGNAGKGTVEPGTLEYWDIEANYLPSVGAYDKAVLSDTVPCHKPHCRHPVIPMNTKSQYTLYRSTDASAAPVLQSSDASAGNTVTWISYDDPTSITKKIQYAKSVNLKGYMFWSADGDHQGTLQEAARNAWAPQVGFSLDEREAISLDKEPEMPSRTT